MCEHNENLKRRERLSRAQLRSRWVILRLIRDFYILALEIKRSFQWKNLLVHLHYRHYCLPAVHPLWETLTSLSLFPAPPAKQILLLLTKLVIKFLKGSHPQVLACQKVMVRIGAAKASPSKYQKKAMALQLFRLKPKPMVGTLRVIWYSAV